MPSGYDFGQSTFGSSAVYTLLQEHQRNSTDDFTASIEWKPVWGTRLTYEEQITHYKGDSYFTMAPKYLNLQEANGSPVAVLQDYDNPLTKAVGITCSATAPANINLPQTPNGLPVVDPSCYVASSYLRSQPTRALYPTETFRLQSSSIKNVTMNGNVRYTYANMNMPNYYDDFQGLLAGVAPAAAKPGPPPTPASVPSWVREATYVGTASAKRESIAADYGITWQVWKNFSISDQVDYSNVHQPGVANTTRETITTASTQSINNTALTTTVITTPTVVIPGKVYTVAAPAPSASSTFSGSPNVATPQFNFFGQKFITNNITARYDATDRTTFTLTYHHQQHTIGVDANNGNTTSYLTGITSTTINENGGIFGVALRPTTNWNINGSAEIQYADNVFTPVAPRQLKHYRIHTTFKPKTWATISGSFNDLERHNNTNNTGTASVDGPLKHEDHSRTVSFNADLMPNAHYGFDFSYAYSDVYTSTNSCFLGTVSQTSTTLPGAATPTGTACPGAAPARSAYPFGPAKDFMDAPTQYASVALALSPAERFHTNFGYRISSVSGNRFFNDPRDVNGSLVSTYQSPFVDLSYAMHKNLHWKGEYNYFGYGEGGRSGAQYCTATPSASAAGLPNPTTPSPVVPCSTLPNTAVNGPAYGFTAPRNFHANNVTVGLNYEF